MQAGVVRGRGARSGRMHVTRDYHSMQKFSGGDYPVEMLHFPPAALPFSACFAVKRISRDRPALGRSEIENIARRYTVNEIAPLIVPVIAARANDGNLLSAFVRRAV